MVLGIVGLMMFPASVAAVVLGHIALTQIKTANGAQGGRGQAIVGLVLGYVALIATMILFALLLLVIAAAGTY